MLFSPCIVCFRRFVFPFFFPTRKCNHSSTTGCSWCYMFPPCVRRSEQQVGHEQQVAAVGKSGFWEPLGDHRSLRSMKCCQGLKWRRAALFRSCTKGDWLSCPKPRLGTSSPRQLLDDSCREEKVIPCAYLWSFKPEQRLPPVRPPSSACKSKSWAELLDHLRHREAPLLSSERFGVGSSDSVDVFVFPLINCLKGEQSKDSDKDGPLSPQKRHWMCKSVLSYLLWGDESLLSSNNFVSAVANLFHSHCEEFESKNMFL